MNPLNRLLDGKLNSKGEIVKRSLILPISTVCLAIIVYVFATRDAFTTGHIGSYLIQLGVLTMIVAAIIINDLSASKVRENGGGRFIFVFSVLVINVLIVYGGICLFSMVPY